MAEAFGGRKEGQPGKYTSAKKVEEHNAMVNDVIDHIAGRLSGDVNQKCVEALRDILACPQYMGSGSPKEEIVNMSIHKTKLLKAREALEGGNHVSD